MITEPMLARSRATDEFKRDVRAYARGEQAARIDTPRLSPPVKVLRVIAQLLHAEPELRIEKVTVRGQSGCSDFVGTAVVETGDSVRVFDFTWCCRWRAMQEGWSDAFGLPDQIRAAHTFEWRCFERWSERPQPASSAAPRATRSAVA